MTLLKVNWFQFIYFLLVSRRIWIYFMVGWCEEITIVNCWMVLKFIFFLQILRVMEFFFIKQVQFPLILLWNKINISFTWIIREFLKRFLLNWKSNLIWKFIFCYLKISPLTEEPLRNYTDHLSHNSILCYLNFCQIFTIKY